MAHALNYRYRYHHIQVQHIATEIDYVLSLSNTSTRLKQQHTQTLPRLSPPCAPEILHKNYAQELAFSLWLSLHLHEIIFVITLSLVIFIFAKIRSKGNDRMTWNDAPAPLALGLVILLSIIFMCSTHSSSFSYVELDLHHSCYYWRFVLHEQTILWANNRDKIITAVMDFI